MSINFNLLKQISEAPGAPGYEDPIRKLIIQEIEKWVDHIEVDNMGNIIALKKGEERKKVMVAAHMDEIGFIINHIDEKGFLHFIPLGGFDPKTLTSQRVVVHGKEDLIGVMGSKPVHVMSEEEKKRAPKVDDYFIDMGMSKEEVEKYIQVGDPVTRERELIEMGDCVNGKSLDNRISVFVLIEALKLLASETIPYDLYAVFTVQEEVGIRGAQVATQHVQPDFGLAIDTTIAFDVPGSKPQEQVTQLGGGVAVKIMDSTALADARMIKYLKKTAAEQEIKWQPELLAKGGTDTAMVQRMTKAGSIAGAISIPTRHIHQVIETIHKEDIQNSIQLLKHSLVKWKDFDWKYEK